MKSYLDLQRNNSIHSEIGIKKDFLNCKINFKDLQFAPMYFDGKTRNHDYETKGNFYPLVFHNAIYDVWLTEKYKKISI